MNVNFSYKAFLFSALIIGNILLIMFLIKIGGFKNQDVEQQHYEVEYIDKLPEETAKTNFKKTRITTNRAYNEAEKFIRQIEAENRLTEAKTETNWDKTEKAFGEDTVLKQAKKKLQELLKKNKTGKNIKKENQNTAGNTTVYYSLVNRKALYLPNPVYTCDASGKVVVNIRVTNDGSVSLATINKTASTTTNLCLWDSALEYAQNAEFSKSNRVEQPGTITYIFPGQ